MPALKPYEELSESTKNHHIKRDSSTVQLILAYDICGWKVARIAEAIGLSEDHIYIIKNSPLYKSQRQVRWNELHTQVAEVKAHGIVAGDPIEQKIRALALQSVEVKEHLLVNGRPELRNAVATDLLDRAGYVSEKKKLKASFELSAKTAQRFERILRRQEPSQDVTLKVEVEQG